MQTKEALSSLLCREDGVKFPAVSEAPEMPVKTRAGCSFCRQASACPGSEVAWAGGLTARPLDRAGEVGTVRAAGLRGTLDPVAPSGSPPHCEGEPGGSGAGRRDKPFPLSEHIEPTNVHEYTGTLI